MPKLRKENPGLRYAQLHNLLYENFKVSLCFFMSEISSCLKNLWSINFHSFFFIIRNSKEITRESFQSNQCFKIQCFKEWRNRSDWNNKKEYRRPAKSLNCRISTQFLVFDFPIFRFSASNLRKLLVFLMKLP